MKDKKITIHNITRNDWDNIAIEYPYNCLAKNLETIYRKIQSEEIESNIIYIDNKRYIIFFESWAEKIGLENKTIIPLKDFLAEPKEEHPNVRGDNPEYPEDEEQETFDYKTALKKAIDGEKVCRREWKDKYNKNYFIYFDTLRSCFCWDKQYLEFSLDRKEDMLATDWIIYKEPKTVTLKEAILNDDVEQFEFANIKWKDENGVIKCMDNKYPKKTLTPSECFSNQDKQVTVIEVE